MKALSPELLLSFFPRQVAQKLALEPGRAGHPWTDAADGVVLSADIQGYTQLTESILREGAERVDAITGLLNAYLDELIRIIAEHGGDVVKFAGDGLVALWSTEEYEASLETLILSATRCALAIQTTLQGKRVVEGQQAEYRIGIGAGPIHHLYVGGQFGRWEYLISGPPAIQAARAERVAAAGAVVLSQEAWSRIAGRCELRPVEASSTYQTVVSAESATVPLERRSRISLSVELPHALRSLLPGTIMRALDGDRPELAPELRPVTVLFIRLPGLDHRTPLPVIQASIEIIQGAVYDHEGAVHKVFSGEKGFTMVATWGLPPLAHVDNAQRGVSAALDLRRRLGSRGIAHHVGCTVGRVFCGPVGSTLRREYTVIGDVVNLCSRLMEHEENAGILCNRATVDATRGQIEYDPEVRWLRIRGLPDLVPAYNPISVSRSVSLLVGRNEEQRLLSDRLQHVVREGAGLTLVIEGDQGIGKTTMADNLALKSEREGFEVLRGGAEFHATSEPFHGWRGVFRKVLGSSTAADGTAARRSLWEEINDDPELRQLLPLVNVVLPVKVPETEFSSQLDPVTRADNTPVAMLRMLRIFARSRARRLLVCLDDAQWLDSASWSLCRLFHEHVPGSILVVVIRRSQENESRELATLLETTATTRVRLGPLTQQDIADLIRARLTVETVPGEVVRELFERSGGNPFFVHQEVSLLLDGERLFKQGRDAQVADDWGRFLVEKAGKTPNISALVFSRLDALGHSAKRAVQFASVIGRVWPLRILQQAMPPGDVPVDIPALLEQLQSLEVLRHEPHEAELSYGFRHPIFHESIYSSLFDKDRRAFHLAIARWYTRAGHDAGSQPAILAHHFSEGDVPAEARPHLERAGEQAMRSGAFREAAGYYERLLAFCTVGRVEATAEQRATWEYQAGEAHAGMGHQDLAATHLTRSLTLLGHSMPGRGVRFAPFFVARNAAAVLGQLARIALRRNPAPSVPVQTHPQVIASRGFQRLAQTFYFLNAPFRMLYMSLRAVSVTEDWGASPELAKAYANASMNYGVVRFDLMARRYGRMSAETANLLGDPSARAWSLELTEGMYRLFRGRLEEATGALEEAADICTNILDRRRWAESIGLAAIALLHRGRFQESLKIWNEIYAISRRRGDGQQTCWGLIGRLVCQLRLDDRDEIHRTAQLLERQAQRTDLPDDVPIWAAGVLAEAWTRLDDVERAEASVQRAVELTRGLVIPMNVHVMDAYFGMGRVLLGAAPPTRGRPRLTLEGLWAFLVFASLYDVARPNALLCTGLWLWRKGLRRLARFLWVRGIHVADGMQMPFEKALLQLEVGRHLPARHPERTRHLEEAGRCFSDLGAEYELSQVMREIGTEPLTSPIDLT